MVAQRRYCCALSSKAHFSSLRPTSAHSNPHTLPAFLSRHRSTTSTHTTNPAPPLPQPVPTIPPPLSTEAIVPLTCTLCGAMFTPTKGATMCTLCSLAATTKVVYALPTPQAAQPEPTCEPRAVFSASGPSARPAHLVSFPHPSPTRSPPRSGRGRGRGRRRGRGPGGCTLPSSLCSADSLQPPTRKGSAVSHSPRFPAPSACLTRLVSPPLPQDTADAAT